MDKIGIINRVSITLAIILYGVILAFQRRGFVELAYLGSIILFLSIFWFFIDKIGWRIPLVSGFLKASPNLNGRWEGSYRRHDSQAVEEITMNIKQTWTSVVIRSLSMYADSISHTAHIVPVAHANSQNTFYQLVFTWSAEAKDVTESAFEGTGGLWGTTMLIVDADTPNILKGHYYTNLRPNQTRGTIDLQRTSS